MVQPGGDGHWASILAATPDAIVVVDAAGTIQYANPALQQLHVSPSAIVGDSLFAVVPAADRDRVEAALETVQEDGSESVRCRHRLLSGDGGSCRVESVVGGAPDIADGGAILTLREVEPEDPSPDALTGASTELELFRTLVDEANDFVYVVDTATGGLVYVNERARETLGYDRETLIRMSIPDISAKFDTVEAYRDLVTRSDRRAVGPVENEHVTAEGETIPVEVTARSVDIGTTTYRIVIGRDVSERRRQRQRLERYREAVEGSTDMLAATDAAGRLQFANAAYRQFHGLDAEADLAGRHLRELLGAEHFASIRERVERVLDGERVSYEMTRQDATGDERILEVQYYPLTDDAGTIDGSVASLRDVTERRERERELETLISNLPGVVYRCRNEPGWPMETLRGRCAELVGYPAEAITDGSVSWGEDLIHPADRETVYETIQERIAAEEPFTLTYRIQAKDGTEKWVWEQGRAVTPVDADAVVLEGFITDITERKRLQEDLLASKEEYESLFESIQDAIVVADTDGRIQNANPAFADLFGYDLAEIEGRDTGSLFAEEADYEAIGRAIASSDGDLPFEQTITYRKRSGATFPGETLLSRRRDPSGDVRGYVALVRDVSDREDRIRHLKIIDRVLRHNLHNSLNVIDGYARTIQSTADEPVAGYAETIVEHGEKLLETADKEREITTFLADPPARDTIDLVPVVRSVLADLRERYPGADVVADLPAAAEVSAARPIGQAIEEVLENAFAHSDRTHPHVEVVVETDGPNVTVTVRDDGPGIPEMEQGVLRREAEIDPLYHGSGLGLWLVNLIVRQSGGRLAFEANEPRGSIVTVRLPAA